MIQVYYVFLNRSDIPVLIAALATEAEIEYDGLQVGDTWVPPYMLDTELSQAKKTLQRIKDELGFSDGSRIVDLVT